MCENVDGKTEVYTVWGGNKELNTEPLTKEQAEDIKQKYNTDGRRTTKAWIEMLLQCPYCKKVQEQCDAPDFFYECGGECGEQYEILTEIQASGFNVVTCGSCGDVFIHRLELSNAVKYEHKLVLYNDRGETIEIIQEDNYHELENQLNDMNQNKYYEAKIFCNGEEIEHRF